MRAFLAGLAVLAFVGAGGCTGNEAGGAEVVGIFFTGEVTGEMKPQMGDCESVQGTVGSKTVTMFMDKSSGKVDLTDDQKQYSGKAATFSGSTSIVFKGDLLSTAGGKVSVKGKADCSKFGK